MEENKPHSLTVSAYHLDLALDGPVARAVPLVYAGLGVLLVLFAPLHVRFLGETGQPLSILSGVTGAGLLLIGSLLRWKEAPASRGHTYFAIAIIVALANAAATQWLTREPFQTTNFILIMIANASISLRPGWFAALTVATLATWAAVAGPMVEREWAHYGFAIGSAALLGVAIFVFRNRTFRLMDEYRLADREARSKLALSLAASEDNMRRLAENAQDVLYRLSLSPRLQVMYVNPAVEQLTGYAPETFLEDRSLVEKIVRAPLLSAIPRVLAKLTGSQTFEIKIFTKNGDELVTEHHVSPVFDDAGRLVGIEGICRDITERARLERELRQREQALEKALHEAEEARDHAHETEIMFRNLVEQSLIGIVIIQDGVFRYLNPTMEEMFGYAPGELFEKPIRTIVSDKDWPTVMTNVRRRIAGEIRDIQYGFEGVKKDGSAIDVYVQGVRSTFRGKAAVLGTTLDVTLRNRAVASLEENERKLSTLMANLPGIAYRCSLDRQWTMQFISEGVTELTGYTPDEIIENRTVSYEEIIHPEDREMVWGKVQEALAQHAPFKIAYRAVTRDGEERWFWEQGRALYGPDGSIEALEGFISDITAQKTYEAALREAKEKAEEANLVKSSIFANMSHEIRTPMTAILGYSDLLRRKVRGTELEKDTEIIQKGGRRLLQLLNNVLDLARIEAGKTEIRNVSHPLAEAVERVVGLLGILAEQKGLELDVRLDENIHVVTDEHAEEQVITNILGNAIKFTERGRVSVTGTVAEGTPPTAVLVIEDTGKGISPAFLPHVFDEFRQESEGYGRSFEGSGLGLAISKKLVEAMGGSIEIQSEPNRGTKVTISLPLAESPSRAPEIREFPHANESGVRPRRAVLVVEDDEHTGRLLSDTLAEHEVELVHNGEDALARAKERHYDIVLLDINLKSSRLDGVGVLHALRKMVDYSDTPIFAVTAYAMQGDHEKFLREGFTGYVPKPFEPDAVNQLVNRAEAH